MQQSLSAILFPGYRRRVLGLLFLHPDEALHGREIARRTGLPPGTLNRELSRLADAGLLKRERRGNQLLYSAERACPIFEEVASILRKTSGLADVLIAALEPARAKIQAAFVYGSVAAGQERNGSDVDLMVIGENLEYTELIGMLMDTEAALGRPVNPNLMTPAEWQRKRADPSSFVSRISSKPRIFLIGSDAPIETYTDARRSKPTRSGLVKFLRKSPLVGVPSVIDRGARKRR